MKNFLVSVASSLTVVGLTGVVAATALIGGAGVSQSLEKGEYPSSSYEYRTNSYKSRNTTISHVTGEGIENPELFAENCILARSVVSSASEEGYSKGKTTYNYFNDTYPQQFIKNNYSFLVKTDNPDKYVRVTARHMSDPDHYPTISCGVYPMVKPYDGDQPVLVMGKVDNIPLRQQ